MSSSSKVALGAAVLLLLLVVLWGESTSTRLPGDDGVRLVADPPIITLLESAPTPTDHQDETERSVESAAEASGPTKVPSSANVAPVPQPPVAKPAAAKPPAPKRSSRARVRKTAPRPKKLSLAFLLRTQLVVSEIGSGISEQGVVASLQRSLSAAEYCLRKPIKAARVEAKGVVRINAEVGNDGRLRQLRVQSPLAQSEACLRRVYSGTTFPRPGRGAPRLAFTLEFETSD